MEWVLLGLRVVMALCLIAFVVMVARHLRATL
jgi:hypothetical protein